MTPEHIEELEQLEKAATPGPWEVRRFLGCSTAMVRMSDGDSFSTYMHDAEVIVAARNALLALCQEWRRLTKELSTDFLCGQNNALREHMVVLCDENAALKAEVDRLRQLNPDGMRIVPLRRERF